MNIKPKAGTKPKVLLYVRVSTVEQAELGHSLNVQSTRLRDFASSNGWAVLDTFTDEGKSARTLDRPSFEALLDYCEDNQDTVDAVLIQDTSRLCRNAEDHLYVRSFMRKRSIRLISLEGNNDDTDEGQFLDLIIAGVNELESKRTGRKTKRIMLAMFENGFKPGMAPVGYLNSYKKGVPMYIDNEKAVYIKKAFSLWNSGEYSLNALVRELNEQGFRSKHGKMVGKSALQKILKSIEYAGGLSYDGKINENAQHKAIISMEEFQKAQQMFAVRNRGANRNRKHNTLLAGLAFCFKCGQQLYGEYHNHGNYYRCKNCKKPYGSMELVDDYIKTFFDSSYFTETGIARIKEVLIKVKSEQGTYIPQQKRALEARKTALDEKMRIIEDKMLFSDKSAIDKSRLQARYEPLKEEMAQLEHQLKNLNKPSSHIKDNDIEKVLLGLTRLGDIYVALGKNHRKQLLRFFIKKAFVDCESNKITNYELVPEFETLISRDFVRISFYWLPRVDSNHQPTG